MKKKTPLSPCAVSRLSSWRTPVAVFAAVLATWSLLHSPLLNSRNGRWIIAALIVLFYLVFCLTTALTHKRRQREMELAWNIAPAASEGRSASEAREGDAVTLLAFASQTGFAEQLALRSADSLRAGGIAVRVVPLGRLKHEDLGALAPGSRALFIVSTTGEGDAPDSAAGFARRMRASDSAGSSPGALNSLSYGLLALGDRSYAHYCSFGHALDHWLRQQHAQPLFDIVEVDNADEGALRHWQHQLGVLSGNRALADWSAPHYEKWILNERRLLNPGSAGGAAFHLGLRAVSGAIDTAAWQAGDIAEIGPRHAPTVVEEWLQKMHLDGAQPVVDGDLAGPAADRPDPQHCTLAQALASRCLPYSASEQAVLQGLPPQQLLQQLHQLPHREYSIASLPQDGALELLVRQMTQADGRLGLGSGWLTEYAHLGGEIALRVRANSGFHTPPDARPLILIGNGTGLAGLRAHIKARALAGRHRNWLLFGERTRAGDFFLQEEIEAWHAKGILQRVDLAFSRDQPQRIYVQDRLREAAEELQTWVAQGAAVYVCGSLQGMATGVNAALEDILGEDRLIAMAEQGLYRRDVY
jgi:sulfite reductase (NADPH) flavoprotein alpha-component